MCYITLYIPKTNPQRLIIDLCHKQCVQFFNLKFTQCIGEGKITFNRVHTCDLFFNRLLNIFWTNLDNRACNLEICTCW